MDLESVFHELRDPLTRRLERMVGDPCTAEDLRQEAFARAWKSAPRDAAHGHLCGWLHRTAHNLAVDELRRRGLRAQVDERSESIGKKIREAEVLKTPYMLVVGDQEQEAGTVSMRRHREGDVGAISTAEFAERALREIAERR